MPDLLRPLRLTRNAIQCRHCLDVISSSHRHDFRYCKCGAVYVDGGLDYCRRGYRTAPEQDYIELSLYSASPSSEAVDHE